MSRSSQSFSSNFRIEKALLDRCTSGVHSLGATESADPTKALSSKPLADKGRRETSSKYQPTQEEDCFNVEMVWAKGADILKEHLDQQIYTAWIKPLSLEAVEFPLSASAKEAEVTIVAPNKFCRDHVQRHYGQIISHTLSEIIGSNETVINFRVSNRAQTQLAQTKAVTPTTLDKPNEVLAKKTAQKISRPAAATLPGYELTNLNAKYNFSNFVVGGCNQFAHAVSLKISENLGTAYNPLFIYGGVGLGKTHLANAIGNACFRRSKKVMLISSEMFVSELISAIRTNNMDRFRCKFRSLDLLIIDDIQFIIGKERTQEEFFHTFNELYNRHKQIVITSDKVPQELVGLEERLRTRFASGLSADLQVPDFETRVAILAKKSETSGLSLPEEVASLISEKIDTNIRELEGALNRLKAVCSLHDVQPNVEITREVLRSVLPSKKQEATPDTIQKSVASCFNVSISDLTGKRRTHNIAFARQVAMFLCRKLTNCSFPEIGALFGGRDHSTVIHACKVIEEKLSQNEQLKENINSIEKDFRD